MAKILNAYRGYTASAICAKAEVPAQANMSIAGTCVQACNITMSSIKNAIGGSNYSLSSLATSGGINACSGFSPKLIGANGCTLSINNPSSNYSMGSFAGYDHQACRIGWITSPPTADVWVNVGGTAEIVADVLVSQLQYQNAGIEGVTLGIYYCDGLCASGSRNFNAASVADSVTSLSACFPAYLERTYTGRVWLVNNTSEFDGSQVMARLPNTSDFNFNIKIRSANEWHYDATGSMTLPSPWYQNGGAGMNWSTGVFDIGMIAANASYSNLQVCATLFDCNYSYVCGGSLFNGTYYPLDDIYGSVDLGDNLGAYGYHVRVEFLESY